MTLGSLGIWHCLLAFPYYVYITQHLRMYIIWNLYLCAHMISLVVYLFVPAWPELIIWMCENKQSGIIPRHSNAERSEHCFCFRATCDFHNNVWQTNAIITGTVYMETCIPRIMGILVPAYFSNYKHYMAPESTSVNWSFESS